VLLVYRAEPCSRAGLDIPLIVIRDEPAGSLTCHRAWRVRSNDTTFDALGTELVVPLAGAYQF
jgi:hypothetical protein